MKLFTKENYLPKKTVVCDIDGTISIVGDRLKYIEQSPKDYDSFYDSCGEDLPNMAIVDMVKSLSKDYKIVFCTGRRENVRKITDLWITRHFGEQAKNWELIMRPDGDKRHDIITKPEQLFKSIPRENIAFVLEDRTSMVSHWRKIGLTCLQVADGDF
jgi:hypothetical protein